MEVEDIKILCDEYWESDEIKIHSLCYQYNKNTKYWEIWANNYIIVIYPNSTWKEIKLKIDKIAYNENNSLNLMRDNIIY